MRQHLINDLNSGNRFLEDGFSWYYGLTFWITSLLNLKKKDLAAISPSFLTGISLQVKEGDRNG
ncbi:hypothetical protein BIV59_21515 [Bacillus sp. MUM 13]|nr:hypothetical protein BIV59_21515 [Bacillus sp. MUM 13]